jgi:hypothetical protein
VPSSWNETFLLRRARGERQVKGTSSRYLGPNGTLMLQRTFNMETSKKVITMKCACCGKPIAERAAWKGSRGFYCSEFCADVESEDLRPARFRREARLTRETQVPTASRDGPPRAAA